MPLVEEFNAETAPVPKSYEMTAVNDQLLRTNARSDNGYSYISYTFDFLNRVVVMVPASGDNRTFLFSEFDQGSLEWHYNKMRQMGRNPRPPEHMPEKPAAPRRATGLNA